MRDPIIHPNADLVTCTKRKRSIWIKNSQRTVDRYTQRKLAEMAAWEDPDDGPQKAC